MELYSEFQLIVSCFPLLFTLTALVELILAEAGRYSQFGFRIVKKKKMWLFSPEMHLTSLDPAYSVYL